MRAIKAIGRHTLAGLYHAFRRVHGYPKGRVLILMYHRVLSAEESLGQFVQPGMYVNQDVFDQQIRFLKAHFDVVSFAELLDLWKSGTWNHARRYCVVTFDDGWHDNYAIAYPVLRCHGVPATIFVPTALIGTRQWFWPDRLGYLLGRYYGLAGPGDRGRSNGLGSRYPWINHRDTMTLDEKIDSAIEAGKRRPEEEIERLIDDVSRALTITIPARRHLLDWAEIQEMSRHGISFGSHSCTHRILTTLTREEIESELRRSQCALRDHDVNHVPVFSYPNGDYTPDIARLVRAAGYEAAVTVRAGFEDAAPPDLFGLRRIGIHNDATATMPLFTLQLSGLTRQRWSTS